MLTQPYYWLTKIKRDNKMIAFKKTILKQKYKSLKRFGLCLGFYFLYSAGASACVNFIPQGTTNNSALFAQFQNNCSYTVVIKARTSNGYQGTWGPIKPGRREGVNPGVRAYRINYSYSNFTKCPSCSPSNPTWPQ